MLRLNNDWTYFDEWNEEILTKKKRGKVVRLPHTVEEVPLHYIDHKSYQKIVGYKKSIKIDKKEGKRYFLQFDGAAHIATIYCNGIELETHECGYTGFRVEITDVLNEENNEIVVKLDTTENEKVPPFGFVIDYLTFGGIYRDVWLDERSDTYLKDVYVVTPTTKKARIMCQVDHSKGDEDIKVVIKDLDGFYLTEGSFPAKEQVLELTSSQTVPWDIDHPHLYVCEVTLLRNGEVLDVVKNTFGYRTIEFTENQFLLNGKPVFIRGLNRHQCYPYVGYAATESLQREDARILKEELHVNSVRTSHYPQSQYFLDECDKLGLLVFTEIPGWQHIGGEGWKDVAVKNTQEMIMQNRQHPSIILWGVRINESMDDDEFYKRTNETAYMLDPYRPTSGVRYLEKSSLLEDVYAYNDFSHDGTNAGAKKKKDVTPDMKKPLLISECNGHMYPTKSYDTWQKRQEHALRHARVMDAAMKDGEHVGCYEWCMFDYPTHQDFGSGDRICYHGVMDMFRNPKLAASVYASQQDKEPVLEIGTSMDIGDYPAGQIGAVYAFTNADYVELYKNEDFVARFKQKGFEGLPHGPIEIDDFIGELLVTKEHFSQEKAELIRDCLGAAGKYGLANLPASYKAKLAYAMMRYHLKFEDGVALYGKYVGNWGGEAVKWRFDAIKNNQVIKSVTKVPNCDLHLEVTSSKQTLEEGEVYDMALVRIVAKDANNNIVPYAQLPISFEAEGPIEVIGQKISTLEGGMSGTLIKTIGKVGTGTLTIKCEQLEPVKIVFVVKEGK